MEEFTYYNPVKIVFGRDTIRKLPEVLPPEGRILVLYGGGSVKRNGIFDQVAAALAGRDWLEFGGIEANPRYETCMRAVDMIKRENIGFLLAVGGGSVLDGVKFIAAAAVWRQGDPWEIVSRGQQFDNALPLGSVITLPATGSEMNCVAVISRDSTGEKLAFSGTPLFPRFSIIDPATTFSLPEKQTVNGIVDTFVHVMEQYATRDVDTPLQDRQSFAIVKTLLEEAPKVIAEPENYSARANLFWCATMGLNGLLACGTVGDWSTHMLGHELTAIYGIDHARTLAVALPAVWRYKLDSKAGKLVKLGREIWNCADAEATIRQTEAFFHSLKVPTRLRDYGIDPASAAAEVSRRFEQRQAIHGEDQDIDAAAAFAIVSDC